MIKKILASLLTLCLCFPLVSVAQQNTLGRCGTTDHDHERIIAKRFLENRENARLNPAQPRNAVIYVPVKFHLVADNNGEGRVAGSKVLEQLCQLNEDYADQEIQFYIKDGFNFINSTAAYDFPGAAGANVLTSNRKPNVLNIFVVNNAGGSGGSVTLAYYSPQNSQDWIVSRKDQINKFSGTLSHEIGHYFTLSHTFSGWEGTTYDCADETPTSVFYFGWNKVEYVSRTKLDPGTNNLNCEVAGDFMCDTPADYNLGFSWNGCDPYTGCAVDPDGVQMEPMENNFMSYFIGCTNYLFTQEQKDAINSDLMGRINTNNSIKKLVTTTTPNTTPITGATTLVSPISNQVTAAYNVVQFDWNPVPNADKYILEIIGVNSFVVTAPPYNLIDVLSPTTNYQWRVTPMTDYYGCATPSNLNQFFTGAGTSVSVDEIDFVNNWTVMPNPVTANRQMTLTMDSEQAFNGTVRIYSIAGQSVMTARQHSFGVGETSLALETENLNPGMYLLTVESDGAFLKKKIIVSK
ncbi:MAG: zinc-dependent metalloprotease [Saprospiraceae bacterium]